MGGYGRSEKRLCAYKTFVMSEREFLEHDAELFGNAAPVVSDEAEGESPLRASSFVRQKVITSGRLTSGRLGRPKKTYE